LNNNLLLCRLCIYPIGNIWVFDEEVNVFIFLGKGQRAFLKKIILFDGSQRSWMGKFGRIGLEE
jgi:hypothetical protein